MLRFPSDDSPADCVSLFEGHPDEILVVIGTRSLQPYLCCPVRLIRCEAAVVSRLLRDISSMMSFEGEDHELHLARAGEVFGDFENELEASDALVFSPSLQSVEAHLRRIIGGEAQDVLIELGSSDPKLLWETASGQWDESFYLRVLDAFGLLHRQFATDDDLIASAIERGWLGVLKRLADVGVRFDQPGADGEFPLHRAAWHGKVEIVRFLLALGVDPIARARDGETALGRSKLCGDVAAKQLHEILWPLEWPAAAKRLAKLDERTRGKEP